MIGSWPKSVLLSEDAFAAMVLAGKVLEQDERGIKVLRLANGNILKIFRVRHSYSWAKVYSYARRFWRNALKLQALGVATVVPKKLYHLPQAGQSAVEYQPLAGITLRDLLESKINAETSKKLGQFIAHLHQLGIHFRSLHFGNIVQTPQGNLGLIDIADMRVYPWALWCSTRVRNFKHLQRYPQDIQKLGYAHWQLLLVSYYAQSQLGKACRYNIEKINQINF